MSEAQSMKKSKISQLLARCGALVLAVIPATVFAELTVASPFTDNAVLQRDMPIPVWGTADVGSKVEVKFAGQTKVTTADGKGKWRVNLAPLKASTAQKTLRIQSAKSPAIELKNILIGEVWICSGQSNMKMGHAAIPEIKSLVKKARNIRAFEVKQMVAFEEQDRCEGRWTEGAPSSAVAFAFAYHLQQSAEVPIGIIHASWGSSSLEAWMPRDMTKTVPHFKTMMKEFDADTETREKIKTILEGKKPWSKKDDIFLRRQTNILYNAMIHPLAPYACRGLVWYQGERNTQSMNGMSKAPWYFRHSGILKYGDTLNQWITRYREEWGNDEMQFQIVMLPGYGKTLRGGQGNGSENPAAHSWAWMRESQMKALNLKNTSVTNTIDLGHLTNIHPKDKLPIGKRLALLAARDTLEQEIEAEGPVMDRVEQKGGHLTVHFNAAKGLKTNNGEAPTAFWLSDRSKKWVKAKAEIKGQTVVLTSPELKRPLYVRYAFAGKPTVNLVNGAGLPAYPFRTDTFAP